MAPRGRASIYMAISFLMLDVVLGMQRVSRAQLLAQSAESQQAETPMRSAGSFWPMKSGDARRSGDSASVAPRNLAKAAWVFEESEEHGGHSPHMHVFHASPILDADYNTYIGSSSGWVYSLDSEGKLRWNTLLSGGNPGNLALYGDSLYASSDDGFAFSLDPSTGHVRWSSKVGKASPTDTYSLLAANGVLVVPTSFTSRDMGSTFLSGLNVTDGSVKWSYNLNKHITRGYNIGPALLGDDDLAFTDAFGGFYRLSLQEGTERLFVDRPFDSPPSLLRGFTTAGAPAFYEGPRPQGTKGTPGSATAFIASNPWQGKGLLRALDTSSGEVIWSRDDLGGGIFAAPAVGPQAPGGRLVLAVLVGENPGSPPSALDKILLALHLKPEPTFEGSVYLLDAWTGATLWTFKTPVLHISTCAGNTLTNNTCYPDGWGAASIGGDGTVYANWSGGWVWALNDANGDGVLDSNDPQEVSGYEHGGGANGNPALAPGLLVVPSCWKVVGFKA